VDKLSWEYSPVKKLDHEFIRAAFKAGYNKAKEVLFTEEQVMEIISLIRTELAKKQYNHYSIDYKKIIQSLKK
jgi:hypothetical protein